MPARPKRTIRQVDLGAASAEHQHTESDITDLDHYDSSDFAADHANADHTHDHDADYAAIAHTHELDELNATGATNGHVLTAQGDGTAAWEAPTGGGVTDHGDLTGLADDDHPQYLTVARHDADDHSSLTITESQISDLDHYDSTDFDADFATKDTDDLAEGATNLYLTDERVQDIIGAMLSGNTETRITVTYQDSDGTIDFEVDGDLSNYTNTPGWIADITGENLEDLANVTITSIASGEVLVWDGTGWVNRTLAEAGISAVGHTHTESDISDLDHTDDDAIHGNVSGEIAALTEKTTPAAADLILIEDSAASNAKKKIQIGNLPSSGGGVTDHGALTGLEDDDHPQYALLAAQDGNAGPISPVAVATYVNLERVTISNPGAHSYNVTVWASCYMRNTNNTNDNRFRTRIRVSFDGGSTFTSSREPFQLVRASDDRQMTAQTFMATGIPSGDIVVEYDGRTDLNLGSVSDYEFREIDVVVHVSRAL